MKILITGGSGFIGKNLINKLLSKLENIEINNLSPSRVDNTIHIPINKNELFDFSNLENDFDYIIHTLALSSEKYCEDFKLAEKINIEFTKDILNFASKQKNLKKLLYFSSIMLYDNENISPVKETDKLDIFHGNYSFTKGIAEQYVKYLSEKQNIPFVILRLSNIYGPGQVFKNSPFLISSKIYEGINNGKIIALNSSPIRDFLYIDDAVNAIVKIIFSNSKGIYNLGTGEGYKIETIVKEIAKQLNINYSFQEVPVKGPVNFFSDNKLIKSEIDWEPKVTLMEGIYKTIQYIIKQ